jgi:NADPH:quinone reductase-like Zn-dependent oxidoreductase
MTEETMIMRAIVVTKQAEGTAGMKLVKRAKPQAAINDVIVQVHASGFVPTELEWPSTWTDRLDRDRTPSIPGHELAGVVTALGYGTTGLSVGQRVFGLADWYRDGALAEYVAMEARKWARVCQSRASPRGRDCSSTAAFRRGRAYLCTARPAQSARW